MHSPLSASKWMLQKESQLHIFHWCNGETLGDLLMCEMKSWMSLSSHWNIQCCFPVPADDQEFCWMVHQELERHLLPRPLQQNAACHFCWSRDLSCWEATSVRAKPMYEPSLLPHNKPKVKPPRLHLFSFSTACILYECVTVWKSTHCTTRLYHCTSYEKVPTIVR